MATVDERITTVKQAIVALAGVSIRQQELLEEVKRDADYAQRIWVWLCRMHGLPEDGSPLPGGYKHPPVRD